MCHLLVTPVNSEGNVTIHFLKIVADNLKFQLKLLVDSTELSALDLGSSVEDRVKLVS